VDHFWKSQVLKKANNYLRDRNNY